ncbi:GntR family transcriptional regulator [Kineococcus sp. SYSU DK003]|uniref:GntR family transcriptional regulator n=1 Tax=Kineococcus sp. SYSU DK003 TaxID=3383124 RepID=UPI003D7C6A7F
MTAVSAFELATSSLTDALTQSVTERIVSGQIAPGEKVTEARLAGDYGVARPTARACLERLVVLGLLRRSVHKTAVVPVLGVQDIEDLFFTRQTVEGAAVAELAQRSSVPSAAEAAQVAIEAAAAAEDFRGQVAADIAFHVALVEGVGSERLRRMHELIIGEVHLTMGLHEAHKTTSGRKVAAEHAKVLRAVKAGDVARAQEALAAHLEAARVRVVARASETA